MGRDHGERWAKGIVEGPRVVGGGIVVVRKDGRPEGFRRVLGSSQIVGSAPEKPAVKEDKKKKKGKVSDGDNSWRFLTKQQHESKPSLLASLHISEGQEGRRQGRPGER